MGCNNCRKSRFVCPAGIWSYDNLIGAKVRIVSTTIGNFNQFSAIEDDYTIKDIYFRVSVDGKTITLVELEGLEDQYFTFKDLEILSIVGTPQEKTGTITIGNNITI
jgi:hypothetical protein